MKRKDVEFLLVWATALLFCLIFWAGVGAIARAVFT